MIFAIAVLAMGAAKPATALVVVDFDPGTTQVTTGISTFSASGETMAVMLVTVAFLNGITSSAVWQKGAGFGSAVGSSADGSWLLYETGDTRTYRRQEPSVPGPELPGLCSAHN